MAAYEVKQVLEEARRLTRMKDLDPAKFCEEEGYADSLAQKFGKDELKPTQLRKIFHALKDIQQKLKSQPFEQIKVMRLMPELAYASGRGLIPKSFYELMKICMSKERLKDKEDFDRMMDFLTAILAYHKMRHTK